MHCWVVTTALFACSPGSETSRFSIHNGKQEELAGISITANEIIIDAPQYGLTGIFKKEKRKYYDATNLMKYAVKFSDDGFKLRDHNEELLWKVKLYDDKIKLANNEEMHNAYEVKLNDGGKIKLEQNESLLTELRINSEAEWFQVNDQYLTKGMGLSLAPAILLMKELTDSEKFIVMAELKAKGK